MSDFQSTYDRQTEFAIHWDVVWKLRPTFRKYPQLLETTSIFSINNHNNQILIPSASNLLPNTKVYILFKHLYFLSDFYEFASEFSFIACCANDVIVDPVIIAASGFVEQQEMIFESAFFQPGFRDFFMGIGT